MSETEEKSALFVATITSFMGPFMISSVNVALPAIQKELFVDAIKLSWIATSYLMAVAIMLVPIGRIADIYGRKKIFISGLAIYTVGTLLAGLAQSVNFLIMFRLIQGFGAAMFVTTGMAILTSIFPPHKRGRAIGIYVAAVYVGLSVGPFAGGIVTQQIGWRSIFFITVPFGIVSIIVTLKHLKGEWCEAHGEKLDIAGCLLYGCSIITLVYGSTRLAEDNGIYIMGLGLVLLGIFIYHELNVRFPVLEIRLFVQNKLFTFSSLAALINYSATYAITFLISLYLQYIKGISPQDTGIILVAQPVMMAIFSPLAGRWSDKIEPRKIASFGMAITVTGLSFFSFINNQTHLQWIIANLALLGFGFAMFSSPNMNAIIGSVDKKMLGIASGIVATMRLLGQMTSMAITMAVFSIFIGRQKISPQTYQLFLKSANVSFLIFSGICAIGIFFSLFRGQLRKENIS